MADQTKCTTLYDATTRLANMVNQLALTPRPPFRMKDQDALMQKSTELANAAEDLCGKDPASIDDDTADQATQSVTKAEAMIDKVNLDLNNRYEADEIVSAIDAAIASVGAT